MSLSERPFSFVAPDGLELGATVTDVGGDDVVVLFPGGGGVDRTEHGFFTRLSLALAAVGFSSMRCEHRAFLATQARCAPEAVTLAGLTADIVAACQRARSVADSVHLLGASLTAGVALKAATSTQLARPLATVALLYPVLDYWEQLVVLNGFGDASGLSQSSLEALGSVDGLQHRSYLKLHHALINELFTWEPRLLLENQAVRSLALHGRSDPVIPFASTLQLCESSPMVDIAELDDSGHGFGRQPLGSLAGDLLASEIEDKYTTWLKGNTP